ncbi:Snf7-domain-containing protein [Obba rivulosa]|uniref:Snf7-domain-containing protein n=1 Tax=Obba rivulosa TaxID=1052685 RepID=A0A8E2J556_9APHY|nr:Snf7-domain-containing protein [Obba rivulosa]
MGGNQSVPKVTAQDRAILDLKLQRDKVKQYQKKIQAVLDREYEIAKRQLAEGHKDRAVSTLRKRKYQESILHKTDAQLENLETLVSTIEFSLIQVSVMHGLKQGNEVLKQIHKELNIENVEKLLEETAEAREYQREIDEMLANTLTVEDEEAVQAELAALQGEQLGAGQKKTPVVFPPVPKTEPVASKPVVMEPRAEDQAASPERERVPVAA